MYAHICLSWSVRRHSKFKKLALFVNLYILFHDLFCVQGIHSDPPAAVKGTVCIFAPLGVSQSKQKIKLNIVSIMGL